MKTHSIFAAAAAAALTFALSLNGLQQTPSMDKATVQPSNVQLDLTAYLNAEEPAVLHRPDECQVFNPGTPLCYMMCTTSPFLRTCEEG